jgi:hypothetical protein
MILLFVKLLSFFCQPDSFPKDGQTLGRLKIVTLMVEAEELRGPALTLRRFSFSLS